MKFILTTICRILSYVLYVLTLTAAYGGHINPHIWATPSIFTLALPYLAMLTMLAVVGWALSRKLISCGLGVAVLVICWAPIMQAVPFGSEKKPSAAPDDRFTLLTYNILGGFDKNDRNSTEGATVRYIIESDADIVVAQEMGFLNSEGLPTTPRSLIDSLQQKYPYRLGDGRRIFAILSKFPVRYTAEQIDTGYSDCIYTLDVRGHRLTVVNTHLSSYRFSDSERGMLSSIHSVGSAKASISEFKGSVMSKMKQAFRERATESETLRRRLDQLTGPVIVCGDFNDVPASWAYRTIRGDDFRDAFAETNFGHKATYNANRMPFHIDHILYRGDLKALSVKRVKAGASDHYPLLASFEFVR